MPRATIPYVGLADEAARAVRQCRSSACARQPGANRDRVNRLCRNLHVDPAQVLVRNETDADVQPYLQPTSFGYLSVPASRRSCGTCGASCSTGSAKKPLR